MWVFSELRGGDKAEKNKSVLVSANTSATI